MSRQGTHARTNTRTYAKGAATSVGGLALTRYGVVQLVHLVELWHFCNVYQVAHGKLLDLVRDLVQRFVKLHAICKDEKRGTDGRERQLFQSCCSSVFTKDTHASF